MRSDLLHRPHRRSRDDGCPRRRGNRAARGAAAFLLVVLPATSFAACGGGDDSSVTTTTADPSAWLEDLESDCAALNEEFAHLAEADPDDAEEAIAHAEDVDDFAEAMTAVLDDAVARTSGGDRPVDDDRLAGLVTATAALEAATSLLAESAVSGDTDAVDDATAEVTRRGAEINALAEDVGVPSCGGF